MDHVCLTLHVLPGKTEKARAMMHQLNGARQKEFDESERRLGITKELWYLATFPFGDHLIGYIEATDFNRAMQNFVASGDAFDQWFKHEMLEVSGLDLNDPPEDLTPPERLLHYEATTVVR